MLAISALIGPIREACWALDAPSKPARPKKKPKLAPGDGCPRRGHVYRRRG
jgi:hypothetical protein